MPSNIPSDLDLLDTFGTDVISYLAKFYRRMCRVADKTFPRFVDAGGVKNKYKICKGFVFLKRVEHETQATPDPVIAEDNLSRVDSGGMFMLQNEV